MQRYRDLGGDSGVTHFDAGAGWLLVRFRDGATYRYDATRPGAEHVARMTELAHAGRGLSTYISRHVRDAYASKG